MPPDWLSPFLHLPTDPARASGLLIGHSPRIPDVTRKFSRRNLWDAVPPTKKTDTKKPKNNDFSSSNPRHDGKQSCRDQFRDRDVDRAFARDHRAAVAAGRCEPERARGVLPLLRSLLYDDSRREAGLRGSEAAAREGPGGADRGRQGAAGVLTAATVSLMRAVVEQHGLDLV